MRTARRLVLHLGWLLPLGFAGWLFAASAAEKENEAAKALFEFLETYEGLTRVQMETQFLLSSGSLSDSPRGPSDGPGWTVGGRFDYVRRGEFFVMGAWLEHENSPLALSAAAAWDGREFGLLLGKNGVLSLSSELPASLPLPVPNPLLLPLDTFSPESDSCRGCWWTEAHLARLRADGSLEHSARKGKTIESGSDRVVLEIPRGVLEGESLIDRLELARTTGRWQLRSLRRETELGEIRASLHFEDYRPVRIDRTTLMFPFRCRLEVFTGAKGEEVETLAGLFVVSRLTLDQDIPIEAFSPAGLQPTTIWDSDAERFLVR